MTVQEANGLAVLDLRTYEFTNLIGLGAKDFNVVGNEIDPKDDDNEVLFRRVAAKGFICRTASRRIRTRARRIW